MKKTFKEQLTVGNVAIAHLVLLAIVMMVGLCAWGCWVFVGEDQENLEQAPFEDSQVDSAQDDPAVNPGDEADDPGADLADEPADEPSEEADEASPESEPEGEAAAKTGEEDAASEEDAAAAKEAEEREKARAEAEIAQAIAEGNVINTWQLPDSTYIYETSIDDLMNADAYFDGQSVQITGEAVGDSVVAGTNIRHRWVTVESETGAFVSVYMSEDQAALIDTFGSYGKTGTILQIRGKYHLVCQDHQGESDIHAESVIVVAGGQDDPDKFDLSAFLPGILTLALGAALMAAFETIRNRRR